jgi:hypothetical protein
VSHRAGKWYRVAVDVQVPRRFIAAVEFWRVRIVATAEHAEPDRVWFERALKAGAQGVVSPDRDLEILCYDHRLRWLQLPYGRSFRDARELAYFIRHRMRAPDAAMLKLP